MYLTVKQQIKHLSKEDYRTIKKLCHIAKSLTNEAIYNIRQYYFENSKFLKYEQNYQLLKSSPNYKMLNSNMAQQILKEVDGSFKSFFALLKLAKEGKYDFKACKLPHYLPKDGYTTLVIGFVRLKDNHLIGRLCSKLEYLCELNGMTFVQQEESYTSQASFWDQDPIPVYDPEDETKYQFSGKRIHRGLYKTAKGKTFNADVNGALNIMRKSNVVDLRILYDKDGVDTPIRIRIT